MAKKFLFSFIIASALLTFGTVTSADYGVQTKTSGCTANQILQDSACTPGAVLSTDTSVVCKVGYTKTVRDVSLATKKQVFAEYGIPYSQHSNYEVDHLISLEIGGSNNISNLWPENSKITDGSLTKDKLENYLHKQVCSSKMTIQEAQMEISTNWLQYYQANLVKPTPKSKSVTTPKTTTTIPSPATSTKPSGATAKCKDGTYSYSKTRSGTCSKHGGVFQWLE